MTHQQREGCSEQWSYWTNLVQNHLIASFTLIMYVSLFILYITEQIDRTRHKCRAAVPASFHF